MIPAQETTILKVSGGTIMGRVMDSLSLLVVAIGSVLVALVAFLGMMDYIHPVSDMKLRGVYARRTPKRDHQT